MKHKSLHKKRKPGRQKKYEKKEKTIDDVLLNASKNISKDSVKEVSNNNSSPLALEAGKQDVIKKENFFKNFFIRKPRDTKKVKEDIAKSIKQLEKENSARKIVGPAKFTSRGFLKNIRLAETLELAGFENQDPRKIMQNILLLNAVLSVIVFVFFAGQAIFNGAYSLGAFGFILFSSIGVFALAVILTWIFFLFYLDMKIYARTKEVERVFPDFLQLASSNISAGMPIDRALWYAVRPNFGVLSKEIETVAKNTLAGQDLSDALVDFSKKYDSKVIQRSVSLILEGLAAGGELADLLNKIALDIEETRLLKQDMAANVTTYVIFITFASIIAAPALLGLSTQLLEVISRITASMASEGAGSGSSSFFSFSASKDAISVDNFRIFCYVMLTISSIFAACIVNVIQKGRVKDGISKIPVFILISILIYFASSYFMGLLFLGLV